MFGQICHPACKYKNINDKEAWKKYCSNNLMDDGGEHQALSPDQINRVHFHLENNRYDYRVCHTVNDDKHFCDFLYPQISYYGKSILIDNCGNSGLHQSDEYVNIYFSEQVEMASFEILSNDASKEFGGSLFEVLSSCACE